jgi:aryl-alcohol dehydrogenase-like predicted oxidoreductase
VPVSELALGTGMFGKTWGDDAEPDEVRSILQGSVEAGGTYIDTADSSQHGEFETRISACVAPNPNDLPSLAAQSRCRGASSAGRARQQP